MENSLDELNPDEDYPFRPSLTKTARCFYCQWFQEGCGKGHELVYPLVNGEHHCPDYVYELDSVPVPTSPFAIPEFPECQECSKFFRGACSGKSWIPVRLKNGKCEFFREKGKTCKYAVPTLQYGNHIRNNYCKRPPDKRDRDASRGWKWMCPLAHTEHAESRRCYRPQKDDRGIELCRK